MRNCHKLGGSVLRWGVLALAAYALIGGSLTLVGWFTNAPRLTDWVGNGISMLPNAAVSAVCVAIGLLVAVLARDSRWARLSGVCGLAVAILAGATLSQHIFGIDLRIDTLIINPEWGWRAAMAPGRMGPPASTAFTLLGVALILSAVGGKARRFVPIVGIVVTGLALLPLTGYLFGSDPLFSVARFTGIAMQTATIVLALGVATIMSVPEAEPVRTLCQDTAAGELARRSLPLILIVPIALGWLRVQGERAGSFDTGLGTALLVLTLLAFLFALFWWSVAAVARHESALRQSEKELQQKVEETRTLLDTLPVGVFHAHGVDCRHISGNAAGYALLRMPVGANLSKSAGAPEIPKHFRVLRDGAEIPPEQLPVQRAARGENVRDELIDHLFDDGTVVHTLISAAPLFDFDGANRGAIATIQDISHQVEARKIIEESRDALESVNARLEAIISSAMDAVITIDSQQRIILFNPAAETMFGLTANEARGRHIECLIPERFRVEHSKFVNAFGQTGISNRQMGALGAISGLRANGEEFPIEASISHVQVQGEHLFTVILRDVTERMKSEERLAQLAAIVQYSRDAVLSKTLDGIVTNWNPGAEILFGYSASDMVGQSILRILPPECAAEEDMMLSRLHAGESTYRESVRITNRGARVPVSITCSPVKDAAGNVIGGAEIIRDITEQKLTEEKLRDAQRKLLLHAANLEVTVAERTAKLQETVNDLQSFSYSIAHDMRAPLRAMGTFAQLLLEEISAGKLSADASEFSRRIVIGARRLDNLINDALNYTKTALQEFPVQPVDLSVLVRGLIDTYPNLHAETADIRIDGDLPIVLGNESLLTQCFSNLLGNAVKFVAPGTRATVRVWSETKDGLARIWIQDNGIGIPTHAQARLFTMFQKLDNQYEGTGVGLAIVRKVVERMGGKVGVESEPGRGSRFWVTLNVAPKDNSHE